MLIALDIDGTLIDTTPSFTRIVKELTGASDDDIRRFRDTGGFNDDWELVRALIAWRTAGSPESALAPVDTSGGQAPAPRQESVNSLPPWRGGLSPAGTPRQESVNSLPPWRGGLSPAGTPRQESVNSDAPLAAVHAALPPWRGGLSPAGTPRQESVNIDAPLAAMNATLPPWRGGLSPAGTLADLLVATGAIVDVHVVLARVGSRFDPGDMAPACIARYRSGYWRDERVLVDGAVLHALAARHRVAACTGRDRWEFERAQELPGFTFPSATTMEDAKKPDPRALLRLASDGNGSARDDVIVLFGDTAADRMCVERARAVEGPHGRDVRFVHVSPSAPARPLLEQLAGTDDVLALVPESATRGR